MDRSRRAEEYSIKGGRDRRVGRSAVATAAGAVAVYRKNVRLISVVVTFLIHMMAHGVQ